ncbi:LMBR1 domain-containing protein [Coccidioides immitis RS]|uniref:Probable lysosomal cobalamin transporter n=3 Tax=Coccidioides immitis TaxID=5501 RepID=LMBD1_COCIM|nr:LMBR1 domain-containing protein [Coccidioides immitis RS]Q1E5A9.1 RecName: Full=Probable lysosomal cobalamin transporter [Coccidioides immitis RS]EAS36900.3 LMBR1 domain-containing protein [Coccidioides immitis RS]KMP09809.1 LMBR1 domain-containing protein 1 [Coccidioides immitis RMSCC 2394]TPX25048.1 hypothetical protein DIZ76_010497 [Coccidioides immitis]
MALLHSTLIWIVYAIVVGILSIVASTFVYIYQTPRDRSAAVTTVCIFTLTALLATVLLLPVDVALVSSTTSEFGRRKDWATDHEVEKITYSLTVVYYFLYSLDAVLCLLIVPFTYFWYEEYDEVAYEDDGRFTRKPFWGAFKYTLVFILLTIILFLVGFFVPVAKDRKGAHFDLDYFKRLLTENHGERALTFALGLLIVMGIIVYVIYSSTGLAFFPISFIKSSPSISSPMLSANIESRLEENIERQRQLEGRCGGNPDHLSSKDRRELDSLVREERTLRRRKRLAEASRGQGRNFVIKVWYKLGAVFRPIKLLGGLLLLAISVMIWISMLLTCIDKAKNSVCKQKCGYILGKINIINPVNWVLVEAASVFPADYVIFIVLVLHLFTSSVVGIATIGIRFLWIRLLQIRKGHTSPQALLLATVMLTLITLALNYSISMIVVPQYATYGPQTFCDYPSIPASAPLDCSKHKEYLKPCSELANNPAAKAVCTPSVASTFLNRITLNFPFFGIVDFWAQFVFLGFSLIVLLISLFRTPRFDEQQMDEDAEEAEEEGLLAASGSRFNAAWQDTTGRTRDQRVRFRDDE